ncbi:MAG TPA: YHS domain-containing (seleno)protein [Ideonella sp.]|nr:YHS domain-containing (seleno)protein [Ideonella sp.]
MNVAAAILAPLVVALFTGAPAFAQSDTANTPAVALKGYDVVAYFSEHHPSKGSSDISQDFDGVRYYFSTARNRTAFSADPDHYMPQFGGYCAMGISKGKKFEADPTIFRIVEGKLYVFSSPKAGDASDQDPEILARARRAWDTLK